MGNSVNGLGEWLERVTRKAEPGAKNVTGETNFLQKIIVGLSRIRPDFVPNTPIGAAAEKAGK